MILCPLCGRMYACTRGCPRGMRQRDEEDEVYGFQPRAVAVVISRDPIMDQGAPFEDEFFSRPTMDPDEYA